MPKDKDEGNKRIEAVFNQIGLGNLDPERITEFVENYERSMETASQVRNRKGQKFKDILQTQEEKEAGKNEPEEEQNSE